MFLLQHLHESIHLVSKVLDVILDTVDFLIESVEALNLEIGHLSTNLLRLCLELSFKLLLKLGDTSLNTGDTALNFIAFLFERTHDIHVALALKFPRKSDDPHEVSVHLSPLHE
jgi:uncharacterized Fe-S cluster-containing radical SAM superfamily protein